jgi:hypothetical protein
VSAPGKQANALFSPIVAIGLVVISMLSLVAFFALSAYAPDLRTETDGGAHALSTSAIGYAGLRDLLEALNIPNTIDRGSLPRPQTSPSLVVLTPQPYGEGEHDLSDALTKFSAAPVLIILPKWIPLADPAALGRVLKGGAIGTSDIEKILQPLAKNTKVARDTKTKAPSLSATGSIAISLPETLGPVDSLQTISGKDWIPLVVDASGVAVLAKSRDKLVYVLADPDFANTQGLHDLRTAALSVAVIRRLRAGSGPIAFDVTLNGLGRGPSLLRTAFAPPFLGATLCAILAAALIAIHAMVRFGTPPADAPVYARGKEALANNAADMIRLLHREPHMAARYAMTTRNLVLRGIGARRLFHSQESDAYIQALERGDRDTFAALLAEAQRVNNRSDLVALARKLYEWRQEIFHAR